MLLRQVATVVAAFALVVPAAAQLGAGDDPIAPIVESKPGESSITTRISYYDKPDDGQGNPFLDEELQVLEALILYDTTVSEDLGYSVGLAFDSISSASMDRVDEYPGSQQSGASGDYYAGVDLAFRHRWSEQTDLGWHLGISKEYDYQSINLGGNVSVEGTDADATVTISLDAFLDSVDVIRFNGIEEGSDDRTSVAGTLNWYQIIDPKTHAELGLTLSSQSGFLESPFNSVVLEDPALAPNPFLENNARGVEVNEELPNSRFRMALYGRARRLLSEGTALELGGRIYNDSWGITAFNIEPRLYQALCDKWRMRLRYRFYSQSEADDYSEQFLQAAGTPEFRTQDSDLGKFTAQTLGLHFVWDKSESSTIDFGVDSITRDDGLDQLLVFFGWKYGF